MVDPFFCGNSRIFNATLWPIRNFFLSAVPSSFAKSGCAMITVPLNLPMSFFVVFQSTLQPAFVVTLLMLSGLYRYAYSYDAYFPVGSIWRSSTIENRQIGKSRYQKNILMGVAYIFSR